MLYRNLGSALVFVLIFHFFLVKYPGPKRETGAKFRQSDFIKVWMPVLVCDFLKKYWCVFIRFD